jgi:hypothetical protein
MRPENLSLALSHLKDRFWNLAGLQQHRIVWYATLNSSNLIF